MASTTPPPTRPLLIFDGDCSFCRRWITRWKNLTGDAVEYAPYQEAATRTPSVPREQFGRAVHLVEPDGRITRAAEAVFRSLAAAGQKRYLLWLYEHVAPFRWISEKAYGFIAAHRDPIDRIDRIVVGTETRPATYVLSRAVFLRGLGLIYLIAFISMFVQMDGLFGSNGVLPATGVIEWAKQLGSDRWWKVPTLAHFSASDASLHAICITGIVCSSVLIVGAAPLLMTIVCWATYLSLVVVGQIFLGYQWDALLLETGFLAIFLAPPLWAGRTNAPPSRIMWFLVRWLLFRLMFLSALVKWIADSCWRDLSALRYHFETQPIPTWTAWYMHHSPTWMLATSCFIMFIIEAIVPFLYFAPRRTRMLAFWLTMLLQVNIMLTGNYGFFNLLTIVLAISLLDDVAISRALRIKLPVKFPGRPRWRRWVVAPIAAALLFFGVTAAIFDSAPRAIKWPQGLRNAMGTVQEFSVANAYGLFRSMTKDRPEIIFEGSDDGIVWKEYEFKWKAGDINRRPPFCEPHMPRLDWQMWFAALQPQRNEQVLLGFAVRLLRGQPEVLGLIEKNPFPDHPPRHVRALLYDYRFSDRKPRDDESDWQYGRWWKRRLLGVLIKPISFRREEPKPFEL